MKENSMFFFFSYCLGNKILIKDPLLKKKKTPGLEGFS